MTNFFTNLVLNWLATNVRRVPAFCAYQQTRADGLIAAATRELDGAVTGTTRAAGLNAKVAVLTWWRDALPKLAEVAKRVG